MKQQGLHQALVERLAREAIAEIGERPVQCALALFNVAEPAELCPELRRAFARELDRLQGRTPRKFAELKCAGAVRLLPRLTAARIERLRTKVPAVLRAHPHWVVGDRSIKHVKRPLNPLDGRPARVNDLTTSATFNRAIKRARSDYCVFGVGVMMLNSPFVGLDLDHVVNAEGVVVDSVQRLLAKLPRSYVERSPSGRGLRVFYVGRKPRWLPGSIPDAFGAGTKLECYDGSDRRWLTVTGDVL